MSKENKILDALKSKISGLKECAEAYSSEKNINAALSILTNIYSDKDYIPAKSSYPALNRYVPNCDSRNHPTNPNDAYKLSSTIFSQHAQ